MFVVRFRNLTVVVAEIPSVRFDGNPFNGSGVVTCGQKERQRGVNLPHTRPYPRVPGLSR